VFSAKGLAAGIESLEGVAKECYVCQKKYTDDDVLILNPTDEEKQVMSEKLSSYQKVRLSFLYFNPYHLE
jgi:hypothetical protein